MKQAYIHRVTFSFVLVSSLLIVHALFLSYTIPFQSNHLKSRHVQQRWNSMTFKK